MLRPMSTDDTTMDLVRRFGIPGSLTFEASDGGLRRARVRTEAARATLYTQGAQVTAYDRGQGRPLLFLARRARFEPGTAIRGGVPICFPWFGAKEGDPAAPSHGLARTAEWQVLGSGRVAGAGLALTLGLRVEGLDARLTATFGHALDLTLEVQCVATRPRRFEAAFHTYLAVGDVRRVEVQGLEAATYLDQVEARARRVQPQAPLTLEAETDRIYLRTPPRKKVVDPVYERTILVDTEGAPSTVVWNPWTDKTARLPDLDDDEWPLMLCVETGCVADDAVTLAPGETHRLRTVLSLE